MVIRYLKIKIFPDRAVYSLRIYIYHDQNIFTVAINSRPINKRLFERNPIKKFLLAKDQELGILIYKENDRYEKRGTVIKPKKKDLAVLLVRCRKNVRYSVYNDQITQLLITGLLNSL